MEHSEDYREHVEPPRDMKKQIWKTFWILFVLTVIDIGLYFGLLDYHSLIKNYLFIFLGVVKAYFIIGIFMHMKFEHRWLRYLIIVHIVFVIFFIALMIIEGNYTSFLKSL